MGNLVILTNANLGKDPEVKNLSSGQKLANFSLATTERYKDKSGEKKSTTDWHNCTAWGQTAELIEKYLKKGDTVNVQGKIKTRSYDDKDGKKRYVTEIVVDSIEFVSKAKSGDAPAQPSGSDETDELPF